MIAVIDNYDSFTWNLVQYFSELGAEVAVFRNDAITVEEPGAPEPRRPGDFAGAGRAGRGRDLSTRSGRSRIGSPFSGSVWGTSASGRRSGDGSSTPRRSCTGRPPRPAQRQGIFSMIENPMTATRYHSLAVERGTLPPELEVCAEAEDGEVMGVRHLEKPVFGVQFHPESILTQSGMRLLENFLSLIDPSQPVLREFGNIREAIAAVSGRKNLSADGMRDAMRMIMGGEASPAQIASFLSCLSMKGRRSRRSPRPRR